jgi:hypothetical protein
MEYGNSQNEFVDIRDLITDCTAALCRFGILPPKASKEEVVEEVKRSTGLPLSTNSIGANIAYGTYKFYTPSA